MLKIQTISNHNSEILIWHKDDFWYFYENERTKMKMQGQKGKSKDNIKSYSLDHFEQVKRSKKCLSVALKMSIFLAFIAHANEG